MPVGTIFNILNQSQNLLKSFRPPPKPVKKKEVKPTKTPQQIAYEAMQKKNQQKAAELGRKLQKMPDTTIKNKVVKDIINNIIPGNKLDVAGFLSSMPGEVIRSYGRTVERHNTPEGQAKFKEGTKQFGPQAKKLLTGGFKNAPQNALDLLNNPAVEDVFNASDFVPGIGWFGVGGLKKVGKEALEKLVRESAEQAAKKGIKNVEIKSIDNLVTHEGVERARVDFYKEQIKKSGGKDVAPLYVVKEGNKWGVEDGKHRLQAYKELGFDKVPTIDLKHLDQETLQAVEKQYPSAPALELTQDKMGFSKQIPGRAGQEGFIDFGEILGLGKKKAGQGTQQVVDQGVSSKIPGALNQTLSQGNPPKGQVAKLLQQARDTRVQTEQAGQVTSSISSGNIIPDDVNFPRKPQELNVNRLNLDPSQKQHIVDLESKEIRERLGDKEVLRIAKDAGLDTRTYSIDDTAKKIAEQLNVRRDIVSLEKDLAAATDDLTRESIISKIAEQSRISRTQGTDVARQLAARRIIANELDTPMQRIFKLLDEAGVNPDVYVKKAKNVNFNNPDEVVNFYRDLVPAKFADWVDAVRYNSMLSSPLTHIVNITSNLLNTGVVAPIEKTVAGALDLFNPVRIVKGQPQKQFAGEGLAFSKGYFSNINKATQRVADVMSGKSKITNIDLERAPIATKGFKGALAKTLDVPMKALEAMDQFFMTLTEGAEKGALAYRLKKGGKVVGDIETIAKENAKYRTFRQVLGNKSEGAVLNAVDAIPKAIMKWRNSKNPIVRTISRFTVPFIATPTNIAKQGIEYSPFGFSTIPGAKNKTEQAAKAIMGTVATFGAASLLGSGRLSWAEPTDPDEKAAYRASGQQPYSVKIGDTWVAYNKLPPVLSFNLALVSSVDDAIKTGKISEGWGDFIINGLAKHGNFLADQSYFKQMGDLLSAVKGDPESFSRFVSNYPQQLVPLRAFSGWIARMADEYQRKPDLDKNFIDKQLDQLILNIPGLSQSLPARRDTTGEPIPNQHRFLNAFNPARISTENKEKEIYYKAEQDNISLYKFLKGIDKNKANEYADKLAENGEDSKLTRLKKFKAIDDAGLGESEYSMVGSGIKDGTRSQMIADQLNKLPTKEAKNEYINKLYDLELMTDDIYDQLIKLKEAGKLNAPR